MDKKTCTFKIWKKYGKPATFFFQNFGNSDKGFYTLGFYVRQF